jgi:hypothetical protein
MHGRGAFIGVEGERYDGDWKDGLRHGQGSEDFGNGARYEGAYVEDLPHGVGTYTAENGEVYAGSWSKGCFRDGRRWAHLGVSAKECGFE